MPINPSEILFTISSHQPAVWQSVSVTVSESIGELVSFENPLPLLHTLDEIFASNIGPHVIAQFSISELPQNPIVMSLPTELGLELASKVVEGGSQGNEEALSAELKGFVESVVQGFCLAVGNLRNDNVVATGLTIKVQPFALPDELQRYEQLIATNVAMTMDDISGIISVFIDPDAAATICGASSENYEEPGPAAAPFESVAPSQPSTSFSSSATPPPMPQEGLDLLMDIPLEISVELGRVKMQVREVVDLGAGSIVEIDKAAGEPVDVLVNGRLVARGEVVVIEDNFGVRITEILSQQDRLSRLNEAA